MARNMHCVNRPGLELPVILKVSLWRTIHCKQPNLCCRKFPERFIQSFKLKTVSLETKKHPTAMSLKAECAWARVCIRHTKQMCSHIKKSPDEAAAKFGARTLAERYKLYSEHFKEYPRFSLSQYEFNRVSKVIDERLGTGGKKGTRRCI